ncbi:MAG TPA: hypothetical protein VFR04_00950 [Solirubrobacterales bacterium]|nr:hypothetical protein [Solirubrobacterales bacterium]
MRKATFWAMAAAIVAMFAIPGPASASWTIHHVPNAKNVELQITGTDLFFETSTGGVTCNTTISKVLFEGGSTTGTVNTFEPEGNVTTNCQGRGALQHCDVHSMVADNLPWTIHTFGTEANGDATVTITTGTITSTLKGIFCPHIIDLQQGTVSVTVGAGEVKTTSTASLSGILVATYTTPSHVTVNASVSGTVHVLGTITYGV